MPTKKLNKKIVPIQSELPPRPNPVRIDTMIEFDNFVQRCEQAVDTKMQELRKNNDFSLTTQVHYTKRTLQACFRNSPWQT